MKFKTLVMLLSLLLYVSCNTLEVVNEDHQTGSSQELIKNGDVSKGTEGWGLYAHPPAEGQMLNSSGEIEYKIGDAGSDSWHIQGHYAGLTFVKGANYTLTVEMYSDIEREGQIRIQLDTAPYTAYLEQNIQLTTEKQKYVFDFVMQEPTDEYAKLCFNLGTKPDNKLEPHSVFVDNLSVVTDAVSGNSEDDMELITLNQVGYLTDGVKEVRVTTPASNFNILSTSDKQVVYTGTFTGPIDDDASGDMVYVGDFSDFIIEGEYLVSIEGIGETDTFVISNSAYDDLQESLLNMLYLQRCGYHLDSESAGVWAHDACHLDLATIYGTDRKIDVSGGWHDAGDYGRYVGPGAKTIADLLLTGDITEKLLEEIKYELDWMLKMQDDSTGGVYHKVTTTNFIGSIMPDESTDELIVSPISSTATGQFAAITAMASRYFRSSNPSYADTLIEVSEKAWNWLLNNPVYPGFTNPPGITTGEYGDPVDGDERYWAAIELFLATDNQTYHDFAIETYIENKWSGMNWIDLGDYGNMSYLLSDSNLKDSAFNDTLTMNFLDSVSELSSITDSDGYGISLDYYYWGSNGNVSDNGLKLIIASKLSNNQSFKTNAERHINYLLGSNALGYSYVTGFGHKRVLHSHHRPSNAAGEIMPGMLAGGPNQDLQDPLAKSKLSGSAPQKCYIDAEPSYSTNEITIYWNSAFYALLTNVMN